MQSKADSQHAVHACQGQVRSGGLCIAGKPMASLTHVWQLEMNDLSHVSGWQQW